MGFDFGKFCVVAVGMFLCVCISTAFFCNVLVILEYICDNWWIAAIWSSPMLEYGDGGAGFCSAFASSSAAIVAFSADDLKGRGVLCGKNSTQSESRSPLVLVTYT